MHFMIDTYFFTGKVFQQPDKNWWVYVLSLALIANDIEIRSIV